MLIYVSISILYMCKGCGRQIQSKMWVSQQRQPQVGVLRLVAVAHFQEEIQCQGKKELETVSLPET